MATVYADFAFNMSNLSMYYVISNTSYEIHDNTPYVSPLGNTYEGFVRVGFTPSFGFTDSVPGFNYFASADVTRDAEGIPTGGTGQAFIQTRVVDNVEVTHFGIEGYSVSSVAVREAFISEGDTDDIAIFASMLSADDTFTLSDFADYALGFAGNDLMQGNGGNDELFGGDGNDTLAGGSGADTLRGGAGNDVYDAGVGDVISENAGEGRDTVRSPLSWVLSKQVENLRLMGSANCDATGNTSANKLTGNAGANLLAGLAGKDALLGQQGNDTLNGGLGNDNLNGGSGADVFVFDTALSSSANVDQLAGFVHGIDKIYLDDDIFSAFNAEVSTTLLGGRFYAAAGATAAHDSSDRIVYDTSSGTLYYDADGAGGVAAVAFAVIGTTSHPTLGGGDFVIVT